MDSPWSHKPCPNLIQHVSSLQEAKVLPDVFSSPGFPWDDSLLLTSTCSGGGVIHGLQVDLCIPTVLLVLQGHSPWSPWAGGESALATGVAAAPPSPLTLVPAGLFLSHILILLFSGPNYCCTASFFPFLSMLSHTVDVDLPCQVVGPSWSQLPLAHLGMGEASASFPQKPRLNFPTPITETLPRKPNMSVETR